jgi:hypothetical protein
MLALVRDLTPLILGVLLTWTGATTLLDRSASQQPAAHALVAHLIGEAPAIAALRIVGWAELLVGLGLLIVPTHRLPAVGAVALGVGYAGILAYIRRSTRETTVRWQSYVRAGLVVVGGLLAANAATPWWMAGGQHPVASFGIVVVIALTLVALSAPIDQLWARHTQRLRVPLPHARADSGHRVPDVPEGRVRDAHLPERCVPERCVPERCVPGLDGRSSAWTLSLPLGEHGDSPDRSSAQPS